MIYTDNLKGNCYFDPSYHPYVTFPLKFPSENVTRFKVSSDLVTYTEEILDGKLYFFVTVISRSFYITLHFIAEAIIINPVIFINLIFMIMTIIIVMAMNIASYSDHSWLS